MTYDLSKANCCRRRGEIFQTEAAAAKSAGQEPGSVDVAVGHSNGSDLLDLMDVCPCVISDFLVTELSWLCTRAVSVCSRHSRWHSKGCAPRGQGMMLPLECMVTQKKNIKYVICVRTFIYCINTPYISIYCINTPQHIFVWILLVISHSINVPQAMLGAMSFDPSAIQEIVLTCSRIFEGLD